MKVEMGWENVKLGMQARPPWKRRSQPFPSGQRPTRQIRCRIHRQLRAECSLHFLILQTKNEPSPFGKETEKAHLCCTTPVKRRRTLAAIEEKKSPHSVKFRNIFRTAAFVIVILPSALGIFFRGGTSFRYGSPIMLLCSLYLIDEVLAIILFYRLEMTDDIGDP